MTTRFKQTILLSFFVLFGLIGWYTYSYFFDTATPHITVSGIEMGAYYAGDLQCSVATSKRGRMSVLLDGQPLLHDFSISAHGNHPFTIPTRAIVNGQHMLRVEFVDATYGKNRTAIDRLFYVDNQPLKAALMRSDIDMQVFQGRTLHVQFQVNKDIRDAKVHTLSQVYDCFAESKNSSIYECFIPIACEETPNEYLLSVDVTDNVGNKVTLDTKFQIVLYPFKKQALNVSKEKVQESKALGRSIAEREQVMQELAANSVPEKLWRGTFCTPVDIDRVSCEFGAIRTTQEKGRYMHKALDLLSAPKSVVWATQSGVVACKERFEDTGNTVIIDHGRGLLSLFCHLEDYADIKVGQKIALGNPLGTLGKTGYATGYHLHWEMRMNNVAIDPMQWTKSTF